MEHQNDKDTQLIDKYLAGLLSEEETVLFNQKMSLPIFKEKVELLEEIKKGVAAEKLKKMKTFLQGEEKKINKPTKTVALPKKERSLSSRYLRLAAGILAIAAFSIWLFSKMDQSTTHLYADYFKVEKNVLFKTEKGEPDLSREYEVFRAYDEANYPEAIKGFDELLLKEDNDDYRFYKVNALLKVDQTDKAIVILQKILAAEQTQFLDESKFTLALAYLRINQKEAARPLLEELSNSSFYKDKVEKILLAL